MQIELLEHPDNADYLCGLAAATCTRSGEPYKALKHSLKSGHESVLEHVSFTFRIRGISRACLAQLTRHRLASFSVQSQRYVRLEEPDMVIPESIQESEFLVEYQDLFSKAINLYQRMVDTGIPAEDARYTTTQAVPTTLIVTMNARELRHFFVLRCCNRAQWEIRELADKMLELCREKAPMIFADAGPGCVNGDGCKEARPCGNPRTALADTDAN